MEGIILYAPFQGNREKGETPKKQAGYRVEITQPDEGVGRVRQCGPGKASECGWGRWGTS